MKTRGLSDLEASARLAAEGPNAPTEARGWRRARRQLEPLLLNPLLLLLLALGGLAYGSGDAQTAHVIWAMMALAVGLQAFHEIRGERVADELRAAMATRCRVLRGPAGETALEVPAVEVVRGDVVLLAAGDMVPADGVLLRCAHLMINQASMTGESAPVRKQALGGAAGPVVALESAHAALAGTLVVAGTGVLRVERVGDDTEVGRLVGRLDAAGGAPSRFNASMEAFTWMMIRFIMVLAPLVLALQLMRQGWRMDAFMYAVSVSVGLAPEMLPMIFTACLVYGASQLARQTKCVVKRANAMQALGSMDVLCTDKTGTLTEDSLSIHRSLSAQGQADGSAWAQLPLALAKLTSELQSASSNAVERAIRASALAGFGDAVPHFVRLQESQFDFEQRFSGVLVRFNEQAYVQGGRASPFVESLRGAGLLRDGGLRIVKGAVEEVLDMCSEVASLDAYGRLARAPIAGFDVASVLPASSPERILAVAVRQTPVDGRGSDDTDGDDDDDGGEESDGAAPSDLLLIGFVTFTDPPKASAAATVAAVHKQGVAVLMLTGDTMRVAAHVAAQVGIRNPKLVVEGKALQAMAPHTLRSTLESCRVYARLTPEHKRLLVAELQAMGRTVGFVGDGVNDVAALQAADVGVSVASACDAARGAADVLLTKKDLDALEPAIMCGRMVFLNMIKYLKMAASSNFGNMFSVVGASLLIPFIPMLPIQVVTSNFLYDLAQLGVPSDTVNPAFLARPLRLDMHQLQRFIILVGFISSVFDYVTFGVLYFLLGGDTQHQALFHTGWFVEGLLSQTLIVFVLRSPSLPAAAARRQRPGANRPSATLVALSATVCLCAMALPQVPQLRSMLGFVLLPAEYWAYLAAILLAYVAVTHAVLDRLVSEDRLLRAPRPRSSPLTIV